MESNRSSAGQRAGASRRDVLALGGAAASFALACQATPAHTSEPPHAAVPTPPVEPAAATEHRAALDELFAELTDERPSVPPISAEERTARRRRAGTLLQERGLGALICEGGPTMTYLTGVSWGRSERLFALVMLADGSHFWICPAFEYEKAALRILGDGLPGGEVIKWEEHEYAWKPLVAALRDFRVEYVCMEPNARYFIADRLAAEIGGDKIKGGGDVVRMLRGIKDAHELMLLRKAAELTQRSLVAVSAHVKPGMSGGEISAMVRHAHGRLGLENPWDLSLLGAAAAYPHGENDAVIAKSGDFLLVDTGGSFHGYQSDITRTWIVDGKEPGERESKAWHAVRDAQQRAFDSIGPGIACGFVDRMARESFAAKGYGSAYEHFTHRLGHGIGLEGHEDPYFDGGSDVMLQPGMTLSDEPGLYFYGDFGVRLEDVIAVTDTGAEHFGKWQSAPTSPA